MVAAPAYRPARQGAHVDKGCSWATVVFLSFATGALGQRVEVSPKKQPYDESAGSLPLACRAIQAPTSSTHIKATPHALLCGCQCPVRGPFRPAACLRNRQT